MSEPRSLSRPVLRRRRATLLALQRADVPWLWEGVFGLAFIGMFLVSWQVISERQVREQLVPAATTTALLIGTLVPAMTLIVLFGRRMAKRRAARTIGSTGRLHARLVWLFSLIAAVPTLLVVIFASILFQSGVEFWFSSNSRSMLENANGLARGYYQQSLRDVGNQSLAMAGDLRDYLHQAPITSPEFAEGYSFQVLGRQLNESAILQKGPDGKLRTAAIVDPDEKRERQQVAPDVIGKIDGGQGVVVLPSAERIEAVTAIDRAAGIYLYVARKNDPLALNTWRRAQSVLNSYDELTSRARNLQLRFNTALFLISLLILGIAVWFALQIADRQVAPLAEMISASRQIGEGNYSLRVAHATATDELGLLSRAFNRMTAQIARQTRELVDANAELSERQGFIEAVLASATAGIVSLDADGRIQLVNPSAQSILSDEGRAVSTGQYLSDVAPQLAAMAQAGVAEGTVQLSRGGDTLTLAARTVSGPDGSVITFEDISRQLVDQRKAAWSDVARRIAHEIKNPLTPIQLATERLTRRYRRQIVEDGELFEELTGTIVRQVGDLRRMVDEFSSFARLPKPVFREEDAVELVRQALFLQEVAHSSIDFTFDSVASREDLLCDRHQFGQVMTNILKNAVEAVGARKSSLEAGQSVDDFRGKIGVSVSGSASSVTVAVTDNGVGLPSDRERIVEPYVTTRERGTGLGLAIVSKIVEEHGGDLSFESPADGGSTVILRFARVPSGAEQVEKSGASKEVKEDRADGA